MSTDQDAFRRASARLKALRDDLSRQTPSEANVAKFHEILDQFERAGTPMDDFRIPEAEMRRRVTFSQVLTPTMREMLARRGAQPSPTRYSEGRFAPSNLWRRNVEAAFSYILELRRARRADSELVENATAVQQDRTARRLPEKLLDILSAHATFGPMIKKCQEHFGWVAVLVIVAVVVTVVLVVTFVL